MSKVAVLILTFILSACGEVMSVELERAEQVCKDRGGIFSIEPDLAGSRVTCRDGFLSFVDQKRT